MEKFCVKKKVGNFDYRIHAPPGGRMERLFF